MPSINGSPRGLPDIGKDDVVIAVMGVTGSGKSTFIQHFTREEVKVSHSLESCTAEVGVYQCFLPGGKKIFLVDTPGFDDTYRTDSEILRELANWLAKAYESNIDLSGVIYLHPISAPRVGGAAMTNLRMFKKLCGKKALGNVALVTTMWSLSDTHSDAKERELEDTEGFWKEMIRNGSRVFRQSSGVVEGKRSAHAIVNYLIQKHRTIVLDIQPEMVDQKKELDQTSAGQEMSRELTRIREKHDKEMAALRDEMKEALANRNLEHQKELKEETDKLKAKIKQNQAEMESLKVSRQELHEQQPSREALEFQRRIDKAERRLEQQARDLDHGRERHKMAMEILQLQSQLKLKQEKNAWIREQGQGWCIVM